eukprot:13901542-Ditylum_brightwellii.AAC.1
MSCHYSQGQAHEGHLNRVPSVALALRFLLKTSGTLSQTQAFRLRPRQSRCDTTLPRSFCAAR